MPLKNWLIQQGGIIPIWNDSLTRRDILLSFSWSKIWRALNHSRGVNSFRYICGFVCVNVYMHCKGNKYAFGFAHKAKCVHWYRCITCKWGWMQAVNALCVREWLKTCTEAQLSKGSKEELLNVQKPLNIGSSWWIITARKHLDARARFFNCNRCSSSTWCKKENPRSTTQLQYL